MVSKFYAIKSFKILEKNWPKTQAGNFMDFLTTLLTLRKSFRYETAIEFQEAYFLSRFLLSKVLIPLKMRTFSRRLQSWKNLGLSTLIGRFEIMFYLEIYSFLSKRILASVDESSGTFRTV